VKTFYLVTLGCPKNEVDSEFLTNDLLQLGYGIVYTPQEAHVILVNTCGFLQSAVEEARQQIEALSNDLRSDQRLIPFGCAVKRVGQELLVERMQGLEMYSTWEEVRQALGGNIASRGETGSRINTGRWYAYVKIAEGCDEHCAFCTIPAIKGAFVSKPAELILAEIRSLLEQGIKEIVLIAQNTTAYGLDLRKAQGKGERGKGKAIEQKVKSLAELVALICETHPELPRLRIMYAYPDYIKDDLIAVMRDYPQVCKYLDMPIQHADLAILKAMHRPSNTEKHVKLLDTLRKEIPGIALRTTFIVGFPGEGEQEFQLLKEFIRKQAFDHVGVFQYSPEPGTPAAVMPRQVSTALKLQRYDELMGLQQSISFSRLQKLVGETTDVLIEGEIEGGERYRFFGRSYRSAPEIDGLVFVRGKVAPGSIVSVRIERAEEYDLWGEKQNNEVWIKRL